MLVVTNPTPETTPIPGVQHATLAGSAQGLNSLSVWDQVLAPGAGTPPHRHACDEAVLCLSGYGEVRFDGRKVLFGRNTTLCIPRGVMHQIVNSGAEPLRLIATFAQSPVSVYLPDGTTLDLPWPS